MALVKIYTESDDIELVPETAKVIKLVAAAALNCPEVPTKPSQVETIICHGLDLIGIDYIMEVIACERPNMQSIGDAIIAGLNEVYPDKLFSVYFNLINEAGMAATPRPTVIDAPITMKQAMDKSVKIVASGISSRKKEKARIKTLVKSMTNNK